MRARGQGAGRIKSVTFSKGGGAKKAGGGKSSKKREEFSKSVKNGLKNTECVLKKTAIRFIIEWFESNSTNQTFKF